TPAGPRLTRRTRRTSAGRPAKAIGHPSGARPGGSSLGRHHGPPFERVLRLQSEEVDGPLASPLACERNGRRRAWAVAPSTAVALPGDSANGTARTTCGSDAWSAQRAAGHPALDAGGHAGRVDTDGGAESLAPRRPGRRLDAQSPRAIRRAVLAVVLVPLRAFVGVVAVGRLAD